MTLLPTKLLDAIVQMAEHFPNMLLPVHTTLGEDNVTRLMASEVATNLMMHKTPSLWTRAKVAWIFGHDPNKYRTSIPPCVHPGPPMLTHHLKTFGKSKTWHEIMGKIVHPLSSA